MRITTFNAYENTISNLQSRQRSLQQSQQQLTSGKRVDKPSDDPVAAARAERALAAMTRTSPAVPPPKRGTTSVPSLRLATWH